MPYIKSCLSLRLNALILQPHMRTFSLMPPHWTTYISALLVPIVAIFGALIAYRQWRTAQNNLKLDLFDRRLVVYEAARDYISSIMTSGKTTYENEFELLTGMRGAKWLFDDKITYYLDKELWHKSCDLSCLQSELDGIPSGDERTRRLRAQANLKKWFLAQMKVPDGKFAPFLVLRH